MAECLNLNQTWQIHGRLGSAFLRDRVCMRLSRYAGNEINWNQELAAQGPIDPYTNQGRHRPEGNGAASPRQGPQRPGPTTPGILRGDGAYLDGSDLVCGRDMAERPPASVPVIAYTSGGRDRHFFFGKTVCNFTSAPMHPLPTLQEST
jgi:hypothetical protein